MENNQRLETKYHEWFVSFEKGYCSEDEVYLHIYLGEGLIDKKEYDYWMKRLKNEQRYQEHQKPFKRAINYPKIYSQFNKKYATIINHYRKGLCTSQEMLDAIEIIEKFDLFNTLWK